MEAANGSIHAGEVNGQFHIRNRTGSLKSLVLKQVKGENVIHIANGHVNVQLPQGIKTDEIGFHIIFQRKTAGLFLKKSVHGIF